MKTINFICIKREAEVNEARNLDGLEIEGRPYFIWCGYRNLPPLPRESRDINEVVSRARKMSIL